MWTIQQFSILIWTKTQVHRTNTGKHNFHFHTKNISIHIPGQLIKLLEKLAIYSRDFYGCLATIWSLSPLPVISRKDTCKYVHCLRLWILHLLTSICWCFRANTTWVLLFRRFFIKFVIITVNVRKITTNSGSLNDDVVCYTAYGT